MQINRPTSLNNRLIVEMYKKEALRSKVVNGFASVDQKLTLKGLRVLADAQLDDNTLVKKGSTAYIKEEALHTQAWAQKALESDYFKEPFLIVDKIYVEFIKPPSEECSSCGGFVINCVCSACRLEAK